MMMLKDCVVDFLTDGPFRRTMRAFGNFSYDKLTGHARPDWMSLHNAQAQTAQQRDLNSAHARTFDGGFDAPYITDLEAFGMMSHERIFAEVKVMSAQDIAASVALWSAAAETIETEGRTFIEGLKTVIGSQWSGPAAEAAERGAAAFITSITALARSAELVARSAQTGSDGVYETAARVPEPQVPSFAERALSMTPYPGLFKAAQLRADEAEDYARDVMVSVYAPAVTSADAVVPVLPAPQDPTVGGAFTGHVGGAWTPPGDGMAAENRGEGAVSRSSGVPVVVPAAVEPAGAASAPSAVRAEVSPSGPNNAGSSAGGGAVSRGPDGVPGGLVPTRGASGGSAAAGRSPGGGSAARARSGAGNSGAGTSGGGPGSRAPQQGWRPGVPTGLAPGTPSGVNGAAGTGARSGMGAFAPMAAGAGQHDDKDHQTPKYLHSRRNGEDIIGTLQRTVPSVIGSADTG